MEIHIHLQSRILYSTVVQHTALQIGMNTSVQCVMTSKYKRVGHITCHMQAPYKTLVYADGFQ